MKKVSIVMTYYNRQQQLSKTLESFKQYNPNSFDVTIVDDGSPEDIELPELPFKATVIKIREKPWILGTPAWNVGIFHALKGNPDVVVLQNAECYHAGDILSYAKRVTDDLYLTFGCYSQGRGEELGSVINDKRASFDGESAWYNHPVHNPRALHFCSAITASNLSRLNGFDERFSFGTGYDDDYFLHQVRCLGLKIGITENPFVIHQWHYSHTPRPDFNELSEKNFQLCKEIMKENNYRAQHIFTADFMNIEKNYAVSTHQPIINLLMGHYKPSFIMELGIGVYSTPLFLNYDCQRVFVESNPEWIDFMKKYTDGNGEVILHPVENKFMGCNVPDELRNELTEYYSKLSEKVPTEGIRLLFVDNYSCCRTIAINTLYKYFDLIIYHDCEPEGARVNNYVFDPGLKQEYSNYILISPRTWGGCFVKKTLDRSAIYEIIKPIIEKYEEENNVAGICLREM